MATHFYKIEQDLKTGKKKKACEWLRNLINEYPDDLSLRGKLAQIYYAAGFKDEAGKFWILSEPQNFEMKEAVEIYRSSLSNSGSAILKDIVFRGDKNKLPLYTLNIIKELEADSFKKTKHIPDFKRKTKTKGSYTENKNSFISTIGFYLLVGAVILIPVLGWIKFFELISSLFSN
ncbi:DUF6584 family protein [uncultured Chryseobacterium sp.]|uniref:DUF6584 family protein n=1 Tax=uncultured Chryseobacterium sp. TaxID=259322 RepID=UPI0025F59B30|nr:DUF6584 family protein [uncultured Chryseobacterium sp.]